MKSYFYVISFISLVLCSPVTAQTSSAPRDKFTLLTTPYNKRPLTLFRGQLQANVAYKFAIRSRSFDKDGNLIILKDIGTASVYHYYSLELRYGLTNFLELSASTDYLKRGIRSVTEMVYSTSAEQIQVNTVSETKGMGDILLLASLRLPIEYKWFDLSFKGGAYIPSASYQPARPTHKLSNVTTASVFTVDYHYNYKNGYGVPVWILSGALKSSVSRFSLEADYIYKKPVSEGESTRWDEELSADKVFVYSKENYQYLLNASHNINASLHCQVTGWFNIGLNSGYFNTGGGWTEYWGDKYKNRPEHLFTLEPILEIQISPSLTIYEVAGFPLSGSNIDGPFYLLMTLSINSFPFFR